MERNKQIEDRLRDFYRALSEGDADLMDSTLSHSDELLMVGTDPDEWWTGYADVKRVVTAQLTEMKEAGVTVVGGDPVGYSAGDTGWVADSPAFKLPDGTEIKVRVTGVLINDGGHWRFVQAHASVGASNEEVVGTELTT